MLRVQQVILNAAVRSCTRRGEIYARSASRAVSSMFGDRHVYSGGISAASSLSLLNSSTTTCAFSSATSPPSGDNTALVTESGNVTPSIAEKVGHRLHCRRGHPLGAIKQTIESYFDGFESFDDLPAVVTTSQCFDELLVPKDHVSRNRSDTYYVDEGSKLLRAHMTAHQTTLLRNGHSKFLFSGDVFRRDEIDSSHYPVFHQMDGVRVWEASQVPGTTREDKVAFVLKDLKESLGGLTSTLFGKDAQSRWVDAYFPFTDPSLELEVFFEGDWLEVLGSGVIRQEILDNIGLHDKIGWAFGLGLERLAMAKYDIPDIRLFWSKDDRFHSQFTELTENPGAFVKFKPFSKYPACFKDFAMWTPESFHENDMNEIIRDVAGDLVEEVKLIDDFTNPKTGKTSKCYRVNFRAMDRNLTNEEVNVLQFKVRELLPKALGVEMR